MSGRHVLGGQAIFADDTPIKLQAPGNIGDVGRSLHLDLLVPPAAGYYLQTLVGHLLASVTPQPELQRPLGHL